MTATLDHLVEDRPADAPGRRWLREHGWPGTGDEAWRYAPLGAIAAAAGAAPAPPPAAPAEPDGPLGDLPAGPLVVLVDGRYRADLSRLPDGDGVTVELGTTPSPFVAEATGDAFAAANHAAAPGATRIRVAGGAGAGAGPVALHLVQVLLTGPATHPRTEVAVGPGAELELTETFRAAASSGLTNATTTIEMGSGARVAHLRVVQAAPGTAHVGRTEVDAGADSTLDAAALSAGAGAVRQAVDATLSGTGARVTLAGLSVPVSGAHHDTAVSVRHLASHGTSRQRHVAIVPDGGRSSFTGQVTVAPATAGTDADQQNHNLLLGPSARADTRPWLQIDADDVACTHGATVGRLDEDAVFYMRSRGIPENAARALLISAFARTALDDVLGPGPAQDWLEASSAVALAGVVGT